MGQLVEKMVELEPRPVVREGNRCQGSVQFVDEFGNLITNIPAELIRSSPFQLALDCMDPYQVRWVRTYADAGPGELVSLVSSDGYLEIAVVNGNAARRFGAGVGTAIELHFR
jgi:S-adenosylmethionine hydrolase